MDKEDKHLDGTGLGSVWAKIKASFLGLGGGTLCASNSPTPLTIKGGESANAGIIFKDNTGAFMGQIGVRTASGMTGPYYYDGTDFRNIYHSNNANKSDANWTCANLTVYGPISQNSVAGITVKGDSTSCGVSFQDSSANSLGRIYSEVVSNANILKFNNGTNTYNVYHSGNVNKSDVDWTCKDLVAYGTMKTNGVNGITVKGGTTNVGIIFQDSNGDGLGSIWSEKVSGTPTLRFFDGTSYRDVYHTNNANKSDVSWTCNNLTAHGTIKPNGDFTQNLGASGNSFADLYTGGIVSTLNGGLRFGASNSNGTTRFAWYKDGASYTVSNKMMELDKTSHLILMNNSDPNFRVNPSSGEQFAFGASSNGGYIWGYTLGNAYMRFKDGKVGVRTSTPTCALDVDGDIRARGGIVAGGIADLVIYSS